MAKLTGKPRTEIEFTLKLDYDEAKALEALAGYGTEAFLEVFYKHLGKAYLQPHEKGLTSLFEAARALDSYLKYYETIRRGVAGL